MRLWQRLRPEPGYWAGLLAVLAIATIALWQWQDDPSPAPAPAPASDRLDAYARDVRLQASDETGAITWQIQAPTARYFERPARWELDTPRWTLTTANGAPWRGRSRLARSRVGTDRVEIVGDVIMQRTQPAGVTRLETDYLEVRPGQSRARTPAAVALRGPGYDVDAIGARLWLDEERLELLDDVAGRYQPSR
jgi:lipopolysaccharide export system protein LptC